MIFVISDTSDVNTAIHSEISLVNYMMTAYPDHVFLCRGTFLLTELFAPRPAIEWSRVYMNLLEMCNALYCHDGYRNHPLADYAVEMDMPILDDEMDLDLYLGLPEVTE